MSARLMNRLVARSIVATGCVVIGLSEVNAQQSTPGSAALTPVPRVVWFSGSFRPSNGQAIAPVESVTFAVYADQEGGSPLWQETQALVVARDGRFNVLLGSTAPDGLPVDLFSSGQPRWLGVQFNRPGE